MATFFDLLGFFFTIHSTRKSFIARNMNHWLRLRWPFAAQYLKENNKWIVRVWNAIKFSSSLMVTMSLGSFWCNIPCVLWCIWKRLWECYLSKINLQITKDFNKFGVISKPKVAPQQVTSIPRLELLSAVLRLILARTLVNAFQLSVNVVTHMC